MRAIVIFATLTAVVLARPDVSHLNGYKYNQPGSGAANGFAGNSFNNAGAGFSGGNNELESFNYMNEDGELEDLSSTFQGITSYDAPYVSGNNYQDSASFGSSSSAVTSGAPLEDVSVQVSSSGSVNGVSGNGFSSDTTGLAATSNGLSGGSNGNGFVAGVESTGAGSNGFSAGSSGLSGGSNGFSAGVNRFSGASNGNGYIAGAEGTGSGFSGSSSNGFASGGQNGGINLIQGQSQSFDLTGGSNGGQRVVYKPVIKQGEPIITKNFYVHAAPEEDENVRVEEKVHVVRPQKTYKIIFIKAPSIGSSLNAANYPVYPQNEEKTIVYVLSKKNDEISEIGEIPTPPPAVTHKPEVFFIKYKTKQEAADAVANIQSQFQQESQSTGGGQSLSIGGSGSGNDASNVYITSAGSASSGDSIDQRITPDDIRDETGDIDPASFGLSTAGDVASSGVQDFTSSSSKTEAGPTGGQFALQSSNFGPTGGQVLTQTAQLPAAGGEPIVQTRYSEYNGGQPYTQSEQAPAYSPDSSGSSAEFIPQQFIKIDPNQSAFNSRQQSYLPPNARRFRF